MSGLGGTEHASFRLGKLLLERGHDVILASSDGPLLNDARELGMRWHNVDFYQNGTSGYLTATLAYFKMLRAERPDIIHCQMARIVPACAIAAKFASPKTKVFYHARGLDPQTYPRIAKLFDKLGVYIIANCKHEKAKLIRHGFPENRIAYTYNALPKVGSVAPKTTRDYITLGTLSRLDKVRNLSDTVQIFKHLHNKGLPVKLQIAGIGEELDNLKRQTAELDVSDQVTFLGGIRDLNTFFGSTDILLNTLNTAGDHGAGVGNNILEAGLYRTPVVSYDVAGISEMVIDGQTGFCTPLKDFAAFETAVEQLIKDATLRQRLGDALHDRVTSLCADEEIYRTTIAAYNM